MQQFLLYSGTQSTRAEYVRTRLASPRQQLIHLPPDSLKINDIRNLSSRLALTSSQPRLAWLEEAQLLTLPAQNALLKTLEEPPVSVTLVLTVPSPSSLLPTIVSRCQTISLHPPSLSKPDSTALTLIKQALAAPPGVRLELVAPLAKNRAQALTWIDRLITSLHNLMQSTASPASLSLLAQLAELALSTRQNLQKNANVTLALQGFFLALPRSRLS